jgi:hypothetical protein
MPRKKRHKFKFDQDSVNLLLQECYDDSRNTKAKIVALFNKWEQHATEGGEIAAIGDQIAKLLGAEAKNLDQKIVILRYLKEVVFENEKMQNNKTEVGDEVRNSLIKMVRDAESKKKKENESNK